jgi:S-methylmethionine-dependent homocysteine/selenocysteine methylase/quinol monooxygenase YgiN
MPHRIIVAVNAIFVVSLNRKVEFREAFENQIHASASILSNNDPTEPTLLQCVLGEDLDHEGRLHCHLKYEFASIDQVSVRMNTNAHPLFWNTRPTEEWHHFHFLEAANLQQPLVYDAWIVAPVSDPTAPPNPKSIPPGTTTFCLNANLHIHPSHKEELLSLLEHARSQSIQEPLCVEYNYGESLTNPNTFHVHQQYRGHDGGKEGFDQHAETVHYQQWKQFSSYEDRFTQETVGYTFRNQPEYHRLDSKGKSTLSLAQQSSRSNVILLDGGNGHELKQRGVISDGSFLAGLLANEQQPEMIQKLHCDFVRQGGCQVITTNSFVAVPERVKQDLVKTGDNNFLVEQRTRALIMAAVKCARAAANEINANIQVAGTVPPLTECYVASAVPPNANDMVPAYKFLLETLLQASVDILLAETLSTSREAIAIVRALALLNRGRAAIPPLWIALTIDDFHRPTALRSGESLELALESIAKEAQAESVQIDVIGVNCASPAAVTRAIPVLSKIAKAAIGTKPGVLAYANAFRTTTSEWLASINLSVNNNIQDANDESGSEDDYDSQGLLLPEAYGRHAKEWQALGATIIGGCCGCSPMHMYAVANQLDLIPS